MPNPGTSPEMKAAPAAGNTLHAATLESPPVATPVHIPVAQLNPNPLQPAAGRPPEAAPKAAPTPVATPAGPLPVATPASPLPVATPVFADKSDKQIHKDLGTLARSFQKAQDDSARAQALGEQILLHAAELKRRGVSDETIQNKMEAALAGGPPTSATRSVLQGAGFFAKLVGSGAVATALLPPRLLAGALKALGATAGMALHPLRTLGNAYREGTAPLRRMGILGPVQHDFHPAEIASQQRTTQAFIAMTTPEQRAAIAQNPGQAAAILGPKIMARLDALHGREVGRVAKEIARDQKATADQKARAAAGRRAWMLGQAGRASYAGPTGGMRGASSGGGMGSSSGGGGGGGRGGGGGGRGGGGGHAGHAKPVRPKAPPAKLADKPKT
jgi:uncharacterized membrane protein YgcG